MIIDGNLLLTLGDESFSESIITVEKSVTDAWGSEASDAWGSEGSAVAWFLDYNIQLDRD